MYFLQLNGIGGFFSPFEYNKLQTQCRYVMQFSYHIFGEDQGFLNVGIGMSGGDIVFTADRNARKFYAYNFVCESNITQSIS